MLSNNYFTENEALQVYFNELVDWDEIVHAYEGNFEDAKKYQETNDDRLAFAPTSTEEAVEFYRATLESLGELAGTQVAQKSQAMDKTGLSLKDGKVQFPAEVIDIYEQFRAAGLIPYNIKKAYGGLGLPATINVLYNEILARADQSFAMTLGLLNLAKMLVRFGSEEQNETYVTKMATGDYLGAMALTEPNYGSDLSRVGTRAEKQSDGTYLLTGTKRFISQGCGLGDYPCVLLTMARTGSPTSGARGLSLFIVTSDNVEIAKIEEKMGIHISPTCEVVYDKSPGVLIGKEGLGLTRYSMGMMNDARVTVAALGAGVGNAAFFEANKYAHEREQFGKLIKEIPAVKKILDRMEREVFVMRLLCGEAARTVDNYIHETIRREKAGVSDKEIRRDENLKYWGKISSLFTPISKYYCSETGLALSSDGVQIHGGAGFTEEYDAARIYRDARINTLYEGTTQLQIVASIGGFNAGMSPTGYLRKYITTEMDKISATDLTKEMLAHLEEAITLYKNIPNSSARDTMAFEVVEIGTLFINCLLLERALTRISDQYKTTLERLHRDYQVDAMARIKGDLYRLQSAAAA